MGVGFWVVREVLGMNFGGSHLQQGGQGTGISTAQLQSLEQPREQLVPPEGPREGLQERGKLLQERPALRGVLNLPGGVPKTSGVRGARQGMGMKENRNESEDEGMGMGMGRMRGMKVRKRMRKKG